MIKMGSERLLVDIKILYFIITSNGSVAVLNHETVTFAYDSFEAMSLTSWKLVQSFIAIISHELHFYMPKAT